MNAHKKMPQARDESEVVVDLDDYEFPEGLTKEGERELLLLLIAYLKTDAYLDKLRSEYPRYTEKELKGIVRTLICHIEADL